MAWFNGMFIALFCVSLVFPAINHAFVFPLEDPTEFYAIKVMKNDEFDWELFKAISGENNATNVIVSPISAKLVLALVAEAAVGNSKQQLSQLLPHVPQGPHVHNTYKKILKSLSDNEQEVELNLGTSIYVHKNISPAPGFLQVAKNAFNTPAYRMNFEIADKAAEAVNVWVSHITKGNIKELVTPDEIREKVVLLINAVYFKGKWAKPFRKGSALSKFYVNKEKEVQAPLMFATGEYYYLDSPELNAAILRLPYKGTKYAMTIILPNEKDGLDEVIAKIKPGRIQLLQQKLEKVEVDIYLPKFSFTNKIKLRSAIQSLGIVDIFTSNAQLPALQLPPESNYISDIFQKSGILVNEEGSEAFAASVADVGFRLLDSNYVFRADHPFVFFIEDESTGALLFAGKVLDPTA